MNPKKPVNEIFAFDFKNESTLVLCLDTTGSVPRIKDYLVLPASGDELLTKGRKIFSKKFSVSDGMKNPRRAAVVWEEGMAFRQIVLPEMPEKDFAKALLWEMKHKHDFHGETDLLASDCAASSGREGGTREKIISVFCCERKLAVERLTFIQNLGLKVLCLYSGQAALARLVGGQQAEDGEDRVIFDIGFNTTRLLIIRGTKIMMSRTIRLGGQALTVLMSAPFSNEGREAQYNMEEAERLKISEGAQNPQAAHVRLVRPYFEKMVAEVKRSVDFYEGQAYSRPVKKVFFTGGGSQVKGLKNFMDQFLDFEAVFLSVEDILSPQADAETRSFVMDHFGGCQSALGAACADPAAFNLLPGEIKNQLADSVKRQSIRMIFIVGLVFVGFLTLWTWIKSGIVALQLKAIDGEWREAERVTGMLAGVVSEQRFRMDVLRGALPHGGLLKELSLLTPSAIVLREADYRRDEGVLILKGAADAEKEQDVGVIAQYMKRLSDSPFFKDVTLTSSSQETTGPQYQFEIKCLTRGAL